MCRKIAIERLKNDSVGVLVSSSRGETAVPHQESGIITPAAIALVVVVVTVVDDGGFHRCRENSSPSKHMHTHTNTASF